MNEHRFDFIWTTCNQVWNLINCGTESSLEYCCSKLLKRKFIFCRWDFFPIFTNTFLGCNSMPYYCAVIIAKANKNIFSYVNYLFISELLNLVLWQAPNDILLAKSVFRYKSNWTCMNYFWLWNKWFAFCIHCNLVGYIAR